MRAALFAIAMAACAAAPESGSHARVALAGDSPLVPMFQRVGAEMGIAPETLAAVAWNRTRLTFAHGREVGILGVPAAELTMAVGDEESSIRAGAAWLLARGIPSDAAATIARGVSGRDASGARVVIAAAGTANYVGAAWVPASTSNYSAASRAVGDIDHIVIHDTEGSFDGTVSWFQDPAAQVSAHYVVRSSDGHIVQMVDEKNVAWHDKCFNTNTVGIEHEGYEAHADVWYTEAMYESSAALTAYLADKYGIAKQHGPILGHGEAPDCSDHTDPGPGWDWQHYIDLVQTGGVGTYLADDVVVAGPASLVSGERGTVTVTMTNGGTSSWDVDATRVGTAEPHDRDSALYADGDWISPARAGTVEAQTAPKTTGTFVFAVQAPEVTEPTAIDEAFQLVEGDGIWFGPTFHVALMVTPAETTKPAAGCSTGAGSTGWPCAMLALGALRRRRRRS